MRISALSTILVVLLLVTIVLPSLCLPQCLLKVHVQGRVKKYWPLRAAIIVLHRNRQLAVVRWIIQIADDGAGRKPVSLSCAPI